jgi:queuosine precursor transporter
MKKYKYLEYIIYLNITMIAIVHIISGKIVSVGVLTISAASLTIPVAYLISDVVTEVYGYKQARKLNWILIFASIIMAVFFQLAVMLPPAPGFENNEAFTDVLGQVPRIVLGAWVALFTGQFANDIVLAKMKVLTKGKHLWSRTIGSTVAGQAADSFTFYMIALYNIIPSGLLWQAIASAWLIKVIIEASMTPLTYYVINRIKKAEKLDYYDNDTDFNPFKLQANHTN